MSWTFSADTPEFSFPPSAFQFPPRRPAKESKQKYKTELCRNWDQGFCEFGDRCAFAHGTQELRAKPAGEKQPLCKQFCEYGYCISGTRCQFSHEAGPSRL